MRARRERRRVPRTGLVRPCHRRRHPRAHRQAHRRRAGRGAALDAGPAAPRRSAHVPAPWRGKAEVRAAPLLVGLLLVAPAARADDKPKAEPPDPITDTESREANLETKAPRSGFTFSVAGGFAIMLGGDLGVGR